MPVTITQTQEGALTAYHGVKYGDVDTVLSGIKRPDGSAGNFDDDWKGFYVSDVQRGAIGYATVSEEYINSAMEKGDFRAYEKAGALLKVDFPGPVTVLEVNSEAEAFEIKSELGFDTNRPLIDQMGDPAIIQSKWPDSRLVVLKREVETLPGTYEIIIPWSLAESGRPEVVRRFDNIKNGEDERQAFDSMLNCGASTRSLMSVSTGDRICGLNWRKIRESAVDKTKAVTSDKNFVNSLPKRGESRPASNNNIDTIYESSVNHDVLKGGSEVLHKASLLLWAANTAEVLTDNSSSTLDKATALVGIVPGIGDAFSLADSIENDDAEGIITSSIALAGFTVAQAVPVVGELVDLALLAEAVVSSIVNVVSNYIQSTQRAPVTLPGNISPVTVNGITLKWRSEADQTISLPPNYGRKVQVLEISAEQGKSAPLVAIVGHQNDGYFNLEPERVIVIQDGTITTVNTSFVSQKSTYVAFPNSPITVSYGRPVSIRLSYTTKNTGDRIVSAPFINIAIGNNGQSAPPAPLDVPQGVNDLLEKNFWVSTRFYVHSTKESFSKVSYFNQGGYVASLEISIGNTVLSTNKLAVGQTEVIDLTGHNIPDGSILNTRINVSAGPYKDGPTIKYGIGSGETANLKSWGTLFSPQLDFG